MRLRELFETCWTEPYRQVEIAYSKIIQRNANYIITPQPSWVGYVQREFSRHCPRTVATPALIHADSSATSTNLAAGS